MEKGQSAISKINCLLSHTEEVGGISVDGTHIKNRNVKAVEGADRKLHFQTTAHQIPGGRSPFQTLDSIIDVRFKVQVIVCCEPSHTLP